jgi:hypothetical protein
MFEFPIPNCSWTARSGKSISANIAQVAYDPAVRTNTLLTKLLREAGLNIISIADKRLADQAREGGYQDLPPGIDAVLDVRFAEAGYYGNQRSGG